ncbi:unnamed protein product, partial [Prunus brigantina]
IFNGRDALLRWAREQGKLNNIVIVIKRSDYGGEGKKRPRVILSCERNGNYKSCKSSETTDIRSDANSDMKKCARDTGTKKCGCPFLLKGVNIGDGDDWKLEVVCGVHNHLISEYLQGHSFVERLTEEENALLVDMSKSLVKPRDILVTIKDRDAMNVSTMKTIYNARIRNRTKEFAGRTQMQQFLTKLSEHNYIEWHRTSSDIVIDLFWTHPINIDILRAFPHVLIMDCTYKTDENAPITELRRWVRVCKDGDGLCDDAMGFDGLQRWVWWFARLCYGSLQRDGFCDRVCLQEEGIFDGVGLDIRWGGV